MVFCRNFTLVIFFLSVLSVNGQDETPVFFGLNPLGEKVEAEGKEVVHLVYPKSRLSTTDLVVFAESGIVVFIDNNFFGRGDSVTVSRAGIPVGGDADIWISVLKEDADITVGMYEPGVKKDISEVGPEERRGIGLLDFLNTLFVLFLVLIAAMKLTLGKDMGEYFRLDNMFASRNRDENIFRNRFSTPSTLAFLVLVGMLFGFTIMVYSVSPQSESSMGIFIIQWLGWSGVSIAFIIGKTILVALFGRVFNLTRFYGYHFYNFLRITLVFLLVLVVLVLLIRWADPMGDITNLVKNVVLIGFFLRTLFLLFKLISEEGYNFLHLFSYLCATELLPFFGLFLFVEQFILL